MYSMLLMMAAGTGGEAPAFHGRFACHGCHGTAVAPAGCCGGCYGSAVWGANYSCHGYRPMFAHGGCSGGACWGSSCCGGFAYGCGGGYGAGPVVTFTPYGTTNLNPPEAGEKSTLRVDLPKDAKLFVDGRETAGTGATRSFATPALPRGHDFFYDLRAELMVDGKPVVEEKRVIVRAGGTVNESFGKLLSIATPAGDKVASK